MGHGVGRDSAARSRLSVSPHLCDLLFTNATEGLGSHAMRDIGCIDLLESYARCQFRRAQLVPRHVYLYVPAWL